MSTDDWGPAIQPGSGRAAPPRPLRVAGAPTPLTTVPAAPPFPVDALGGPTAAMVHALAVATQTDPGMAGTAALGCLAAAAGGRAEVEVRDGWREQLNLFVTAVSDPGTRKSAVWSQVAAPLRLAEQHLDAAVRAKRLESEALKDIAEREADSLRRKAGSADSAATRDNLAAEAIAAAERAAGITVPAAARLMADDVTPEVLASLMAEHGGRMAVISAEGGLFDNLAGRYSKSPNLDAALKGHAGDMLRVDRRGRVEFVERPALTLVLAVQPSVIDSIGRVDEFAGRGLLARFLYCRPSSNVGRRVVDPPAVPAAVRDAYSDHLRDLAIDLDGWSDPAVLLLSPQAASLHLAAHRRLEPELRHSGALGSSSAVIEWSSKLMGAIARIAGLLHLADHGQAETAMRHPISGGVMARALSLGDYYIAHALAIFDRMGADSSLDGAREVLRHLQARSISETTVRDLFSALPRSRFPKTVNVVEALRVLEDHGWVEELPTEERTGPGRKPSPTYRVHESSAALSAQSAEPLRFRLSADNADSAADFHGRAS